MGHVFERDSQQLAGHITKRERGRERESRLYSSWHRSWPATTRLLYVNQVRPLDIRHTNQQHQVYVYTTVSHSCISNFTSTWRLRGHTACQYDPVNQLMSIGPLDGFFRLRTCLVCGEWWAKNYDKYFACPFGRDKKYVFIFNLR